MKVKKRSLFQTILISSMFLLTLTGCVSKIQTEGKKKDIGFTVVNKEKIPEELKKVIGENKASPFHITYTDRGKTYIAEGYGRKPKTGYSVEIRNLYEMEETIHIKTDLKGPEKGEKTKDTETYPYIVVETKDMGKRVIFD